MLEKINIEILRHDIWKIVGVHRLLRNTLMFNCQKSTPYCIKHLTYWHCKFHFSISSSLVLPSFHLFTMHLYVTTPGFELCVLQSSRDAGDLKYLFVDIDNSGNLYPCMWELMFFFSRILSLKNLKVNYICGYNSQIHCQSTQGIQIAFIFHSA